MAVPLNGLHWQNPFDVNSPTAREQVNQGSGFGSVLILSPAGPPGNPDPSETNIYWLEYNMKCRPGVSFNEAVIVRLFWPQGSLPGDPASLASQWQPFIQWCQGQGVYNFQVLNELNIEYNGLLWNPTNPNYMSGLAQALRQQNPSYPLYLGFPGPGGVKNPQYNIDPGSANWNTYWGDYASTINSWYDNIALHAYAAPASGATLQSLKDSTYAQATDVRSRFPTRPQRFTEYGITIYNYPGGDTPQNRQQRANDYAGFLNWARSGWNNYLLACHVFLAGGGSGFTDYQLTDTEAQILATGVGCVGQ